MRHGIGRSRQADRRWLPALCILMAGIVGFLHLGTGEARADLPLRLVGHSRHHHHGHHHHSVFGHRHHHHHYRSFRSYRSFHPRSSFSFSFGIAPRVYSYGYNYGYGWPSYNWNSFYYRSPTLYFRAPVYGPRYYDPYCPTGIYSPYFGLNTSTTQALLAQAAQNPHPVVAGRVVAPAAVPQVAQQPAQKKLLGKVLTIHSDGTVTESNGDAAAPPQVVRTSNAEARQRAGLFLQYGDNLFKQQRYHEALQRYKSAAEAAPDQGEAYYRQGLALIGTRRFELAADAFRRALRIDGDFEAAQLPLDELYENNAAARMAHVDQLAQAALANERDPDLFLLLGVLLHAEGEVDRARPFFARVQTLDSGQRGLLAGFLLQDDLAVAAETR